MKIELLNNLIIQKTNGGNMYIIGSIVVVLFVIAFFYLAFKFVAGSINRQIEEAVDKNAPPEVQEEQREKAAKAILMAMNQISPYSFNNYS